MDVYLDGKRLRLTPTSSIGKGGEADIFDIGGNLAAKVFKDVNHPDLSGEPHEQKGAEERICEHQKKLPAFPRNLPPHVVVPQRLLTDAGGRKIVGYVMPLVSNAEVLMSYGDRSFRQAGIPNAVVLKIFKDLWTTVEGIHKAQVVVGDFNDLNILVCNSDAYIIDADSFQFGPFLTKVFTAKFVDPLLCNPHKTSLELLKPHTSNSDWYAFAIMFMQSLLFVHPYGGVYRPKDVKKRIPHDERPLHRITVFNADVRYPKPAIPYGVLPDDLLDYFHKVFEKDLRNIFPSNLIEGLRFTTCTNCGTEHARSACPNCAMPGVVKSVTRVTGKVTSTRFFKTSGVILRAACQEGKLLWLYHEDGKFKREDGSVVAPGDLDPAIRFRISGKKTLLGKDSTLVTIDHDNGVSQIPVGHFGKLPMFDANENGKFWVKDGKIWKDGTLGQEAIGDVLSHQTVFWVGRKMGYGFYRAGNLSQAFVFNPEVRGINDSVKLPVIRGQITDATCVFGNDCTWFFLASREAGKTRHQCFLVKHDGKIEAQAEASEGDGNWLGSIRGKCAALNFLLVATDDGIVRVEAIGSNLQVTREFPDTETYVDEHSELHPGKDGIYVVSRKEISLLKIS